MPLTPFIGLSVLVHICVIVGHWLFDWMPARAPRAHIIRVTTKIVRFIGLIIILVVFAVVLGTATLLIRASLTDQYSSFNLANTYGKKFVERVADVHPEAFANGFVAAVDKIKTKPSKPVALVVIRTGDCPESYVRLIAAYKGSVVDYLEMNNKDFSFEARQKLAVRNGIKDYRGTSEQNKALLIKVLVQSGQLAAVDEEACNS